MLLLSLAPCFCLASLSLGPALARFGIAHAHPENRTGKVDLKVASVSEPLALGRLFTIRAGLPFQGSLARFMIEIVALDQALDRLVPASFRVTALTPPAYLPCGLQGVLPAFSSGSLLLEVGFTLRCLQRLSRPHFASQLCRWHDNCCTSGASIPVLSY